MDKMRNTGSTGCYIFKDSLKTIAIKDLRELQKVILSTILPNQHNSTTWNIVFVE